MTTIDQGMEVTPRTIYVYDTVEFVIIKTSSKEYVAYEIKREGGNIVCDMQLGTAYKQRGLWYVNTDYCITTKYYPECFSTIKEAKAFLVQCVKAYIADGR